MIDTHPSAETFATRGVRRAELYRWFGGLFADRLDAVLLRAYRTGPGRAVLDNLSAREDLAPGARLMEAALDSAAADGDLCDALSRDFGALFEQGRASPRASDWRHPAAADEGTAAGGPVRHDILHRMKDLLRHSGLGLRPRLPGTPDHLAVQLDVLAQMGDATVAAWKRLGGPKVEPDDPALAELWRRQLAVLDDDLLSWLPRFRDACRTYDPDGFYAGAAMLLTAYARRDRAFVAACLGEPGR